MKGGGVVIVVMVHPKKGQTPQTCKAMAEAGMGAFSFDEFGTACWKVYGKQIKINPKENSIMEGFIITNFNFNAGSGLATVETNNDLPGSQNLDQGNTLSNPSSTPFNTIT